MSVTNFSLIMEFILLGFSDLPNLQGFLFGVFLVIYMSILTGNGVIIVITKVDPTLQTPMYFFLGKFSFVEISYMSITLPRMLMNLLTQNRNISVEACDVQLCFFLILVVAECLLLAVMAYDCYVAICKPVYNSVIMNHKVCVLLVVGAWITGITVVVVQTYQIFSLPFCCSNKLNHVFCDMPPVVKLTCGNTFANQFSVYADAVLFALIPFLLILGSYVKIINTILKLPSTTGKYKLFSTCSSHLMDVILFFGSGFIVYFRLKFKNLERLDKVFSLFHTIVTPMFNTMIYTLRNKDVIGALRKLTQMKMIIEKNH